MAERLSLTAVKVDELLKEVRVNYYRSRTVDPTIDAIRKALHSLRNEEVTFASVSATIKDLGVPDKDVALKFCKPEALDIIGSYAARTTTRPVQGIDLAVRMPKACFLEKDFLNYRFYAKRILYLSVLERELLRCTAIERVEWSTFNFDSRKPILIAHPIAENNGDTAEFNFRILPCISVDTFNLSKLSLSRNNVREVKDKEGHALPTPYYNSGIVEDMLLENLSSWLQQGVSKFTHLADAISLAKVWTRQRSMQFENSDTLGGFLISVVIVHLTTRAGKSRITEHMTPLQAFRVLMDSIGNADVLGKGIFLQQADEQSPTSDAKKSMKKSFDVVICDPSGQLNLAHRITRGALANLVEDALRTLQDLKDSRDSGFEPTFMTRMDFGAKFDYHVRLEIPSVEGDEPYSSFDQEKWFIQEKRIETLLCRALTDRAKLVRVMHRTIPSGWHPRQGLACVATQPVFAGILLNNFDIALRMADIGPGADSNEEAKEFRKFWGERSELRRFKDGRICETAVWEVESWRRHLVIRQIVEHVLCRHLSLSPSALQIPAEQLDFALFVREKDQLSGLPKILEVFDLFSKRLRTLEDLPLKVVSVQPLSAVFRHTAVYYPQLHPLAEEKAPRKLSQVIRACLDPLDVVLQLEGSGRWPDDALAIRSTKLAFCLKIARSMQEKWGTSCIASEEAVDVLSGGFAFRLNILYEKDPTHLNKERISSSLSKGSTAPLAVAPNSAGKPQFVSLQGDLLLRSLHASILHGLHGVYHAYSPTVRLAKRWISSHLLSGVLAEEAVELLVAHLFVKPAPYAAPSSRITGFLRFLHLLATFDWLSEPLIVDINGDLTAENEEQIHTHFNRLHRQSQGTDSSERPETDVPAMFIATAYDMGSETWTQASPTSKDLKRLRAYAKSSETLLGGLLRGRDDISGWQSLFRTSLVKYDVVVVLHQESLPYPSRVLLPGSVSREPVASADTPSHVLSLLPPKVVKAGHEILRNNLLVGFDPVRLFCDELRARMGSSWSLWYDAIGGDVVGMTSNKALVTGPEVRKVKGKKATNGSEAIDLQALVREIQIAGEGLVKSIYLADSFTGKKKRVKSL